MTSLNIAILNILSTQKICSSNSGLGNMAILKIALLIKRGVVIFSMFAADRQFGTYAKLFLGVKLP